MLDSEKWLDENADLFVGEVTEVIDGRVVQGMKAKDNNKVLEALANSSNHKSASNWFAFNDTTEIWNVSDIYFPVI